MRIVGDRADFSVSRGSKTTRFEEKWTGDPQIVDEIPEYVRHHWSALMRGESLSIRFVVMFRGETIGFRIYQAAAMDHNGKAAVVIRLRPSSWLIARFVRPIDLLFSNDEAQTLIQIDGPLPVKLRRGEKWADLDGRLVWDSSE